MSAVASSSRNPLQTTSPPPSKSFLQSIRHATRSKAKGASDDAAASPGKSKGKPTPAGGPDHDVPPKARSPNMLKRLESSLRPSPKHSPPVSRPGHSQPFQMPSLRAASMSDPTLTLSAQVPRTRPVILASLVADVFAAPSPPPATSSAFTRDRSKRTSQPPPSSSREISGPSPLRRSADTPRVYVNREPARSSVDLPRQSTRSPEPPSRPAPDTAAARKPKPPPLYPSVASPSSPQRRPTSPASPSATPKRPSRELPSSPTTPTPPSSKMIGTMHRAASSSSALPLSPRETSSPTHRGVSPIGAKSPATRRVTPGRGLSSSSASHLPLGSTARRPSFDQPRPSLNDIQPRRPSLDVRQSTQSSNRSESPATSGTMSARGLTPSPSPGPYHGHRNRNASSSSLGTSNQEHRELIRAAASLLCRELGRSAAQLRRNGFSDQDYEEIEVRMRNLVRLERIWGGPQGTGSNGLAGEERDRRAFTEALRDGYVLCQFMNKLRPGSLVQPNPRDDGFVRTSNVTRFLATCTIQGVPAEDLFQRDDLIEASAESLARVARAVLSLFRITEAPAADRSRIISGGGASSQRGPYGTSSRGTESTPNLALARATSPTSMSGKKKRWSPPSSGLPTVMDSGLDTLREKLNESVADPDQRPQGPPPRSPLRARSTSSRAGLSLNDGSRASLSTSLGDSRQSLASSARTDNTAFSSLLQMERSTSSGQYGTVRTMTTDATSLHLNDDGSLGASVRDDIVGRKSLDLQRVAEESESCATSSSGGKKKPRSDASAAQGQARAEEDKEDKERERRKRINLGKAKWPEDFLDSSHHSNISDLMDEFGSITPPLSTSPSSMSMSSRPVKEDRVEPLPITPKRPSHRARHSVDNPILLPKPPKIRTDLDNSSPSRGLLIRSNTQLSANGPRSPGLRPRQDGARSPSQESGQRRVPFPRSLSGEYGEGLSPVRQASPNVGIEGSMADRPRVPRGRFTSEVDASSSRRRPRPNSLDVQGSKPGRSRFESMVNLGVEKGQPNASDINMRDSVDIRQTLVVKEDGKPAVQYQLGNCIGRGQFGSVYRALNLNTGQMVAVKRIRLEGLKEDEIKQLMGEVDLVKSLSHPSIVKYEGMARDHSTLSIVLEYAENGSLGQTLKAFGKLNERLVASYVVKILDGLHYLHQSHVVHCDLKAANILTTKTGNVKLSDFGVSLNLRNLRAIENERKDVAGTPNWMAPEVIELKGPSFASDIWSLACTIIELLTGRPLYADVPNSMSVMFRIVEDDMPPIPEGCSDLLVDFLHQCFHKDPTKRPTAEVLCEHEWLKKNWMVGKELRQQDSIPFLRRVSTDLQKSSPSFARYLAQVDMPPRSEAGGSSGDDAPRSPVKRNSAATSTGRPVFSDTDSLANFSPREHTFVKTAFGKAMVCRVCKESLKKGAVICAECNLIAHQKCAAIAPLTCDLRSQFLMYAENGGGLAQAADYFAAAQARSVGSSPPTENSFPSPRTSFDIQQQSSSAATSPSIYPPTAFKSMSPFKRSRSSLGSPEPTSASAPKPSSQSSVEDKAPRQRKRSLLTRSHVSHERPLSIASTSTGHNTASMRSALTAAESFSSHGAHRHSVITATDEAGRISPLTEDYVVPSMSSRVTVSSPTPLRRDGLNQSTRSDQGPQAKHKKSKDGCTVQ